MIARLLKICSSVRITVVCLLLLFILTFWGTVAQVSNGLYAVQERFFYALFFLASGFIPFPGAQLILWVLFFNLLAAAFTHFSKLRHWRYAGLKLSHAGLLLYFISAFVVFHVTQESNVRLAEGEATNCSSSYDELELAYWNKEGERRQVTAVDVINASSKPLIDNRQMIVTLTQFYPNVAAFTKAMPASGETFLNGSGITFLQPRPLEKEREKNLAGGVFKIVSKGISTQVLLFEGETAPTALKVNGQEIFVQLRQKRYPLPFTLKLDQVKAEFYPGTQTAKTYESFVTLGQNGVSRQAHIYMNNPLLYKDYAFYQASYDVDAEGRKHSTLAVVKNAGRILPYIACLTVFFGLAAHFFIKAFLSRKL